MIDIILLAWILYLFLNGWNKGAVLALISPLSFVLGILASILYYQKNHNVIGFLICFLLAPLGFAIIFSIIISTWREKVSKNLPPGLLSRFIGAVANTVWGGGIFVFTLMAIPPLGSQIPLPGNLKDRVEHSFSYPFFKNHFGNNIPLLKDAETLSSISQDQEKLEKLQSNPEFSEISEDKIIKNITSDEDLMEQIRQKDFLKVMSNKKIQQALQNEQLLEKILSLRKIIEEKPSSSPPPKVYEIK